MKSRNIKDIKGKFPFFKRSSPKPEVRLEDLRVIDGVLDVDEPNSVQKFFDALTPKEKEKYLNESSDVLLKKMQHTLTLEIKEQSLQQVRPIAKQESGSSEITPKKKDLNKIFGKSPLLLMIEKSIKDRREKIDNFQKEIRLANSLDDYANCVMKYFQCNSAEKKEVFYKVSGKDHVKENFIVKLNELLLPINIVLYPSLLLKKKQCEEELQKQCTSLLTGSRPEHLSNQIVEIASKHVDVSTWQQFLNQMNLEELKKKADYKGFQENKDLKGTIQNRQNNILIVSSQYADNEKNPLFLQTMLQLLKPEGVNRQHISNIFKDKPSGELILIQQALQVMSRKKGVSPGEQKGLDEAELITSTALEIVQARESSNQITQQFARQVSQAGAAFKKEHIDTGFIGRDMAGELAASYLLKISRINIANITPDSNKIQPVPSEGIMPGIDKVKITVNKNGEYEIDYAHSGYEFTGEPQVISEEKVFGYAELKVNETVEKLKGTFYGEDIGQGGRAAFLDDLLKLPPLMKDEVLSKKSYGELDNMLKSLNNRLAKAETPAETIPLLNKLYKEVNTVKTQKEPAIINELQNTLYLHGLGTDGRAVFLNKFLELPKPKQNEVLLKKDPGELEAMCISLDNRLKTASKEKQGILQEVLSRVTIYKTQKEQALDEQTSFRPKRPGH